MTNEAPKNLTPKQNMILYCLQNGWKLITSDRHNKAICAIKGFEFEFGLKLFFRMVEADYIYQMVSWPFHYILTKKGEEVKTKKVVIPGWND